jgi:hypothetical protein
MRRTRGSDCGIDRSTRYRTRCIQDLEQLEQRLTVDRRKADRAAPRVGERKKRCLKLAAPWIASLKPYRGKMSGRATGDARKAISGAADCSNRRGCRDSACSISVGRKALRLCPMKRAALILLCRVLAACTKKAPATWDKTEVMIPMRDGVRLHTLIYAPKNAYDQAPSV